MYIAFWHVFLSSTSFHKTWDKSWYNAMFTSYLWLIYIYAHLYVYIPSYSLIKNRTSYSVCLPISVHFSLQASPDEMPIFHLCGKTCCCCCMHTYKCRTYTYTLHIWSIQELKRTVTPAYLFPRNIPTTGYSTLRLLVWWCFWFSLFVWQCCVVGFTLLWFLAGDSLLAPPSFPANNFNLLCGRLMYRNINWWKKRDVERKTCFVTVKAVHKNNTTTTLFLREPMCQYVNNIELRPWL